MEFPTEITLAVRHLERLPLGTPYPAIVDHVRELVRRPEFNRSAILIVDATGVGQPIVDLLRSGALDSRLVPVTLTSGGAARGDGFNWRVPRYELLARLEIAFQQQALQVSRSLEHASTLIAELQSLRRQVRNSGEETIHPWRDSQHDDFVFATALAHWRATLFPYPRPLTEPKSGTGETPQESSNREAVI